MDTIDLKRMARDDVDPKVLEVYRLLKRYKDSPKRNAWAKQRKKNWDAVAENKIWTEKELEAMRKQGQVPANYNHLNKGVQGSSAIVTDNKPEVKVLPIGSNDLYVAEILKRGIDHVWSKNDGNDVIYDGVEESKIGGLTVWEVVHNETKGGIFGRTEMEEVSPVDIFFDDKSRKKDLSDTPVIKAKLRTKKYIEDNYPELSEEDYEFSDGIDTDPQTSEGVTGEDNYTKDSDPVSSDGKSDDEKCNIWEINAWLLRTERKTSVVVVEDGEPVRVAVPKGRKAEDVAKEMGGRVLREAKEMRVQRIIVGKALIEENTDPYGRDSDGDPVVSIIALKHNRTRNAYPTCPTTFARGVNKAMNKRHAQQIHHASHNINSPIVRHRDCTWKGEPGTPGSELIVDKNAAFQPYRLGSGAEAAQHFTVMIQQDAREIDDQYDLQDVLKGKLPDGQKVAWQSVYALQDGAGTMSKPFMRRLESAMVRIGKVILADILKHWPREKWESLLEPEEKVSLKQDGKELTKYQPEEGEGQEQIRANQQKIALKWEEALERIRPKDYSADPAISMVDLDVKVVAGSSLPTNRMAKSQFAMEMAKAGVYDSEAVLEYIDDPHKDQIAARMKEREKLEAMAAASKGKRR